MFVRYPGPTVFQCSHCPPHYPQMWGIGSRSWASWWGCCILSWSRWTNQSRAVLEPRAPSCCQNTSRGPRITSEDSTTRRGRPPHSPWRCTRTWGTGRRRGKSRRRLRRKTERLSRPRPTAAVLKILPWGPREIRVPQRKKRWLTRRKTLAHKNSDTRQIRCTALASPFLSQRNRTSHRCHIKWHTSFQCCMSTIRWTLCACIWMHTYERKGTLTDM